MRRNQAVGVSRGKDCREMERTKTWHSGFATHVKVRMLDLSNVLVPLEREATRIASPRTTVKRTVHDIS